MTAPDRDRLDSAPSARPLLLIVDDEPLNVRQIAMALKDQYELLTAANGTDALRMMKEHRPDLVLLDVMLPDIDGIEVFRQAQADATLADIPVIFVTVVAATEGQTAALQLSAADYLVKPVNLVHLRLRVRNQLELGRRRDECHALNRALASRNAELEEALARVRHLESIVSICRYCGR